jgi:hypothetical protein
LKAKWLLRERREWGVFIPPSILVIALSRKASPFCDKPLREPQKPFAFISMENRITKAIQKN